MVDGVEKRHSNCPVGKGPDNGVAGINDQHQPSRLTHLGNQLIASALGDRYAHSRWTDDG